jgi:transposase, IS6 family
VAGQPKRVTVGYSVRSGKGGGNGRFSDHFAQKFIRKLTARLAAGSGQTIDFLLNETRSTRAAKRFFCKVLGRPNIKPPRVINVDKNGCYIGAVRDLRKEGLLPEKCKRRPSKYTNNIVEQDHRFIKRRVSPGLGFGSYPTAWRTLRGYETMNMIRKGQMRGVEKGNIQSQNQFITELFGLVV